jgi:hypothetical protein
VGCSSPHGGPALGHMITSRGIVFRCSRRLVGQFYLSQSRQGGRSSLALFERDRSKGQTCRQGGTSAEKTLIDGNGEQGSISIAHRKVRSWRAKRTLATMPTSAKCPLAEVNALIRSPRRRATAAQGARWRLTNWGRSTASRRRVSGRTALPIRRKGQGGRSSVAALQPLVAAAQAFHGGEHNY